VFVDVFPQEGVVVALANWVWGKICNPNIPWNSWVMQSSVTKFQK
jgi:hypothetical protein